jgi:DNA-binding CsgD family transcriptional regulator
MPTRTSVVPYVTLCDPQGTMVWTNNPLYKPGVRIWDYADVKNRELVKDQVSRAAFLKEPQEFQAIWGKGEVNHVWVWPIMEENLGVCLVAIRIPEEILRLTDRERECLEGLSIGRSTADIAADFDVSISTIHTHMKRAREKLNLGSMEQLIAFASRYFPPPDPHLFPKKRPRTTRD